MAGSFVASITPNAIQAPGSSYNGAPTQVAGAGAIKAAPTLPIYTAPATPTQGLSTNSGNSTVGNNITPTNTASSGSTGSTQTAAQVAAQNNFNNEQSATMNTIQGGISTGAGDYNQSILDYFNGAGGVNSQQNTINADAVQNELAKDQGIQGVTDMVNNGIQGGGVVLDNDNAGTSSAADALARAYGVQGRQAESQVGNQYAQGQNTIANDQNNLNTAVGNFTGVDAPTKKADIINNIVSSANQSLTYLEAISASADLPTQINIAQQVAQVKAQATAALGAYDSELATQTAANAPTSQSANQAKAQGLLTAGVAPAQEFNYTSTAPATLQNTGPAASSLPIYIAPANKNNNTSIPITA
jgi:hypothetical protein